MAKVTVVVQPYPLVTLDEAKIGLGEDGDYRNTLISGMILAAQGEMDGPNGWLGISIAVHGLQYIADDFCDPIILPCGPLIDPVEIFYLDKDGVEHVLNASSYRVMSDGTLQLAGSAEWPTVNENGEAVRITYFAGIDDELDPRIAMMKTAIIMHVRMTLDGVDPDIGRKALESIVAPLWVARC